MCVGLHVKFLLLLSPFSENYNILTNCSKNPNMKFNDNSSYLTLQCGMTCTIRHRVNIPCRGMTHTIRHGAHSHLFVYISTTYGANVIGLLRVCS